MSFSSGTFSINTAGQPVVTGTTISSTAFNALTADLATGLSNCVLKDGTQTTTAPVGFVAGLNFTSVAGTSYVTGTTSTTFTFNGSGGTSSAVTLTWQKIGNWVTLNIPVVQATTGTNSSIFLSNTALAAAVRPTTQQSARVPETENNGASLTGPGVVYIKTDGTLDIRRDPLSAPFTDTAAAGSTSPFSIVYFIG